MPVIGPAGRKSIPRQKGLFALLKGLHQALNQTAGIGGYPKIIYINGREKNPSNWILEISDHRSKLALEIVGAAVEGFFDQGKAEDMLEDIVFKGSDFHKMNTRLLSSAPDSCRLGRFLRKYPV